MISDSELRDRFRRKFPVEQIDVPLRARNVVGIVRREAQRRAVGVQLAEHVHQSVARF